MSRARTRALASAAAIVVLLGAPLVGPSDPAIVRAQRARDRAHAFGRDAWDLRYKIKADDGNLWASHYGHGHPIRGDADGRELLLTYDDGPFPSTTPRLLDLLDELELKAVFFVLGHRIHGQSANARRGREILLDTWRRGHVIGCHGFTHRTMPALPMDEQEREIERCEREVTAVIGERPWLYRPPGGRLDEAGRRMIVSRGYTIAWWRYDSLDWQRGSPAEIAGRVTRQLEGPRARGGIVLFHDTVGETREATRLVVEWVRRRNRQLRESGSRPFEWAGFDAFYEPLRRPPSDRVRRAAKVGMGRGRPAATDGGVPDRAATDAGRRRADAGPQ
ncbi:MAG: polysaccharide deacetylase family protein [Deltaproteobacteria bacterium]|nr:polysaccharide deacetylase family protein [Deltaproteobacteria bacterium]